jgi:hypothetical protein
MLEANTCTTETDTLILLLAWKGLLLRRSGAALARMIVIRRSSDIDLRGQRWEIRILLSYFTTHQIDRHPTDTACGRILRESQRSMWSARTLLINYTHGRILQSAQPTGESMRPNLSRLF